MNRNLYGILMKYPEPGRVKTRLAKVIGDEKSAEICQQVAEQVINKTRPQKAEYERVIFYDPPERLSAFKQWLGQEQFVSQQGRDVGERMDNAIRELLALSAEKAIITGADIPDLNREIILQAFAALDKADIVIGPASDGGYYLIGMKEPNASIFEGIPWSRLNVYEETIRILEQQHLHYRCTETLSDLDTGKDYSRYLIQNARPKAEKSS